MGDEATIELGFSQIIIICSGDVFHCPHVLHGQTHRVLNISYSDMSDALLLPILNKCRNSLKELRFRGCNIITAASAAPIGECSALEVLHPNNAVTSRLPEIVQGLQKLRECNFNYSSLTDEGVIGLAMSCLDLEMLDLSSWWTISDAAIASLVQCRALKELNLYYNDDADRRGVRWPVRRRLAEDGSPLSERTLSPVRNKLLKPRQSLSLAS